MAGEPSVLVGTITIDWGVRREDWAQHRDPAGAKFEPRAAAFKAGDDAVGPLILVDRFDAFADRPWGGYR